MSNVITGKDVIAVPEAYLSEFLRDPVDALLKYGASPQRALAPWLTEPEKVYKVAILPSLVTGASAVLRRHQTTGMEWYSGEAHPLDARMLDALTLDLRLLREDWSTAVWHVHVDLGLNRGRKGDAGGIAVGRIVDVAVLRIGTEFRHVSRYVIPLAMQVVAPQGGEIALSAVSSFVLQLRGRLGINVTSFSYDGFQSLGAIQELTRSGLVTAGVQADETGRLRGFGKPFSVDRHPEPYQELKEAIYEERVLIPNYPILTSELIHLEDIPGQAPDHPWGAGSSKDVADAVAGCVGYLAAFGHAVSMMPLETIASANQLLPTPVVPELVGLDPGEARLGLEGGGEARLLVD